MRNATFAIVALLLAIGAAAAYWSMHSAPPPPAVTAKQEVPDAGEALKVVVAPASESARRAALVLPKGPSEDARSVLGAPPVPPAPDAGSDEDRDYLPERQVEWVAELDLKPGAKVSTGELEQTFNAEWMTVNGNPIIYGLDAARHHWTYVGSAEPDATFTQLQLGWRLLDFDGGKAFDLRRAKAVQQALEQRRQKLTTLPARFSLDATAAVRRAEQLEALRKELDDAEIDLVLLAPEGKPFDGRLAWDVLTCLGLEWGDGDYFHWNNPTTVGAGDESLFSVSTGTPPGYLLPEVAAKGELQLEDLSFGFYVPRTHDPQAVLEAMLRGAKYAQKRLGGTLTTPNGQPLDEATLRARVKEAVGKLQDFGLEPGSTAALQLL